MTTSQPQTTRIPNFFHLVLFLLLTVLSLIVCEIALALLHPHNILNTLQDQRLQLFATIATYALTILAAILVFPLLWHRSFASGISFNPAQATPKLILAGLGLGLLSQATSTLLPIPKELPIEKIFQTPGIIWTLALFGTLIAPLFEEIVFRGFLLPALAIALDYLRLPKSPDPGEALATLTTWRTSDTFSRSALITSSILTSFAFASIHAPQLGFSFSIPASWSAIGLLIAVSLVLCYIRVRTRSVAASTLVHSCYNLSVFLALFLQTGGFRHMDKL